mgnify:CR=1 FL=1
MAVIAIILEQLVFTITYLPYTTIRRIVPGSLLQVLPVRVVSPAP